MDKRPSPGPSATLTWSHAATLAIVSLPVVPALLINIEQARDRSWGWLTVAVASVVLAPAAMEAAVRAGRARERALASFFLGLAAVLFVANVLNAVTNATHTSDLKSDHRRAMVAAEKSRETKVALWSQRRAAQVAVAGEASSAAIEAELSAMTAANADKWQATGRCDPERITAPASRSFCAGLSALVAKRAAAVAREQADKELEALQMPTEAPANIDPFAASVASILAMVGVKVPDAMLPAIGAAKDWIFACVVELLAALGPLVLLHLMSGRGAQPAESSRQAKQYVPKAAPPPATDPVHVFIVATFETRRGAYMKADEPWQLWLQHCADKGVKSGTQRAFGLAMKAHFEWERNNNRPRYVNVCRKGEGASVRLAVSNS